MSFLIHLDQQLFLFINGIHSDSWDVVMYWLSDKWIWAPLYAILLFLLIREYRSRTWMVIVGIVLLVVLTDQLSVKLFKDVFMRLRPCHEPSLEGMVRILYGHCGGKYGFVSSHATNTFGIALYTGLLLRNRMKWLLPSLMIWAGLVSYSRIYLGVHYPGDVLVGGLLGSIIGYLVYRLFLKVNEALDKKSPA